MRRGFNPFLVRASVYCPLAALALVVLARTQFQSLLSQGISLLDRRLRGRARARRRVRGFNPFLVRASVYWRPVAHGSPRMGAYGFNPFLVRASVYCVERIQDNVQIVLMVSIPS